MPIVRKKKNSNDWSKNQNNNEQQSTGVNNNNNNESKKRVGWSGLQGYQGFQKLQLLQNNNNEESFDIIESIILDTGSTFTLIKNKDLLTGVRITDEPIKMKTNMGTRTLVHIGNIPGMKQQV